MHVYSETSAEFLSQFLGYEQNEAEEVVRVMHKARETTLSATEQKLLDDFRLKLKNTAGTQESEEE